MLLLKLYEKVVYGAMKGLDRIRFRGTHRWLASDRGIQTFAMRSNILLKDFGKWAENKTLQLRESCVARAQALGSEIIYLTKSTDRKDDLARKIAEEKGVGPDGSICMFSVVEPCWAPSVSGNRASKRLELNMRQRKCVFIYHYFDDPEFGFGHVRLQSWLPMSAHICLNGRHWLEKQMKKAGMRFVKSGNCFPWVEDIPSAQRMLDAQLETDWPKLLNRFVLNCCPDMEALLAPFDFNYYWSADETEYATDVLFHSEKELSALYPSFIRHAMMVSDSPSVMRYLGKGGSEFSGKVLGVMPNEIITDLRRRAEGVRIKHFVNNNSVKMYNKSGSVLRIETTINNTRDFKVFRPSQDEPSGPASWKKMGKGVNDLHRRCQISERANERYADTMSAAKVSETLQTVAAPACNPVQCDGRRHRALNPWNKEDHQLLLFLARGEHALNGFRNKDLRAFLDPSASPADKAEAKRLSGKATRRISLLRAHGLIQKVSHVNRYVLTAKGRKFATGLLSASLVDIESLMEKAA